MDGSGSNPWSTYVGKHFQLLNEGTVGMKKIIVVLVVIFISTALGAQSVWTGTATVGGSSDFPGTADKFRAASNSFPTGTVVEITNINNDSSIEVIIVGRLDLPGVQYLIEPSGAEVLGLSGDQVLPVRVVPMEKSGRFFSSVNPDSESSNDPDYNLVSGLDDEDLYVPPAPEIVEEPEEVIPIHVVPPTEEIPEEEEAPVIVELPAEEEPVIVEPVEVVSEEPVEESTPVVVETPTEEPIAEEPVEVVSAELVEDSVARVQDLPKEDPVPAFVDVPVEDVQDDEEPEPVWEQGNPYGKGTEFVEFPVEEYREEIEGEFAEDPIRDFGEELRGEFAEFPDDGRFASEEFAESTVQDENPPIVESESIEKSRDFPSLNPLPPFVSSPDPLFESKEEPESEPVPQFVDDGSTGNFDGVPFSEEVPVLATEEKPEEESRSIIAYELYDDTDDSEFDSSEEDDFVSEAEDVGAFSEDDFSSSELPGNKQYFLTPSDLRPPDGIVTYVDEGEMGAPFEVTVPLEEESAIPEDFVEDESSLFEEFYSSDEEELTLVDDTDIPEEIILPETVLTDTELSLISPQKGQHYVQIAAYKNLDGMDKVAERLKTSGYPLGYALHEGASAYRYRLLIGPLRSSEQGAVLQTVRATMFPDAFPYRP